MHVYETEYIFLADWHISLPTSPSGGWPVRRKSFMSLLGISASRLVRTRRTFKGVDARTFGPLASA